MSRRHFSPRRSRPRYEQPEPFAAKVIAASVMVGLVVFMGAPQLEPLITGRRTMLDQQKAMLDRQEAIERSVYYPGCNAARAAGAAPINRGSPGYRSGLDGDGDGVACEPYYGN